MKKFLFIATFLCSWLSISPMYAQNVAKIGSTEYETLQEAVDDAYANMTGDVTITLLTDITANTVVRQKSGLNQTIDGNSKTVTGQILIDGCGNYGTDVLVIKNINFSGTTSDFAVSDAFVGVPTPNTLPSPYTVSRLSDGHNITIDNCTFTSTSAAGSYDVVGFKSASNANVKGLTITNCSGTNLHSFAQLTGTTNATFDTCEANSSGSFIGVNGGGGNYSFSNCTFPSSKEGGYAIRIKSGNTATVTLTNNNLTATDAIILGSAATLTVESGTYNGIVSKTAGNITITGGTFTDNNVSTYLPQGYSLVNNDDVYTVFEGNPPVAQIGSTQYSSLAEAVDAAVDGDVITLIADDNSLSNGSKITIDKSLTITGAVDAQGNPLYTIYGKNDETGPNDLFITGSGTVTISNVKVKNFGNNANTDPAHAPIYVSTNFTGTVNFTNVYVSDFNRGGIFLYGGTFNVDDCYIDCANARSGAFTKGIEIKGSATGTIQNTVICNMERSSTTYSTAGIEIYGNGSIIVDNCTIISDNDTYQAVKGTYGIVSQRVGEHDPSGGSLQVTGTMINCTNACLSVADNDAYGPVNNYTITVEDCDFDNYIATWSATSSITINSGSYTEDVYADAGTIIIHGGEFSNFLPDTGTNGSIVIDGGTFDADPSAYLAEGYISTDLGDGIYGVVQGSFVAQIGDVKYESLAAAVAAVPAGTETTITMIADETIVGNAGVTIPVGKNIVLDLNGKTVMLSVTESKGSQLITNRGILTITDSSDEQNGTLTNSADESLAVGSWPTNNYVTNVITNSGTLNITAGNIVSTANGSICYAVDNNNTSYDAILNITGGYLTSVGTVIRQFCNSTTKQNVLNVSGGTIETNGSAAIWTQLPGSNATSKKLATLNITGGEITAASYAWYDYSYGDSFEAVDYSISGGKFTGSIYSYAVGQGVIDGFITGGLFSAPPSSSNIETPGYMFGPSEEAEGYYTLVLAEVDYSWTQNGQEYHDYLPFNTPFKNNYLMDGEFIELLKNVTLTENIACQLEPAEGATTASFTMTFGDYTVTKGDYSVSIKAGVSVITDKQTDIFSAAEGNQVVETVYGDGYIYTVEEANYVAQIGTTKYTSLAEAVAAVPAAGTETTITMIANETINVTGYAITIPDGKNVVLDLNGYKVAGTCSTGATSALIYNKGTLTIQDSSAEGTGELTYDADPYWVYSEADPGGYASDLIKNEGTLVVNSGSLYNQGTGSATYAIDNFTAGSVTINGGKVDAAKASAIRMFYVDGGSITVNGGVIGHYSDYDFSYMGIQVQNGTNANVTITGGIIAGNYALYANNTGGSINISGGILDRYVMFGSTGPKDISITGGAHYYVYAYGDQTGFISGGVYISSPNEAYCVEGYLPVWDSTKSAYVVSGPYAAKIGTVGYATFAEAVTAAEGTQTITLLADVAEAYTLAIDETLIVKLNNHTLTVNAPTNYNVETTVADGVTTYTTVEKPKSEQDIELVDGQPYTITTDTPVNSATYKRTISSSIIDIKLPWYVPFDYTITADDAENFTFYKINLVANSATPGEVQSDEKIWLFLNRLSEGDVLYANRPYLFKASNADTYEFTTEGATLLAKDNSSRLHNETSNYNYDFYGIYETTTLSPKANSYTYYMAAKGVSYLQSTSQTFGSYRWYIQATQKVNGDPYAPVFVFVEEDDDATGIKLEDNAQTEESYYNLNGMRINKPANGVYIIKYSDGNVKKVAVK